MDAKQLAGFAREVYANRHVLAGEAAAPLREAAVQFVTDVDSLNLMTEAQWANTPLREAQRAVLTKTYEAYHAAAPAVSEEAQKVLEAIDELKQEIQKQKPAEQPEEAPEKEAEEEPEEETED